MMVDELRLILNNMEVALESKREQMEFCRSKIMVAPKKPLLAVGFKQEKGEVLLIHNLKKQKDTVAKKK